MDNFKFWQTWLFAVSHAIIAFGLVFLVAVGLPLVFTRKDFVESSRS